MEKTQSQVAAGAAVHLIGLHKRYGDVRAVDGVDLTIAPGEIVALLGPNGAGKSTTVDLILGLTTPDQGDVTVFGSTPEKAVAHGAIGAMLQGGSLLDDATVGEMVTMVASLHRKPMPVAAELHRAMPACRIIICTTFGRPGYLSRAMAAGAAGFVVKDAPPEQLVDAVRRVHNGLRVVDPALAAESLANGASPLTAREHDVLKAAKDGSTVADVARALHLSEGTVRNHLSSAIGKTGARTRAEAVRLVEDRGWL
jgi:DNA-binding NarL/FixJ family response regulator